GPSEREAKDVKAEEHAAHEDEQDEETEHEEEGKGGEVEGEGGEEEGEYPATKPAAIMSERSQTPAPDS
ncbi:MAG: hypothetical protein ACNA7T_15635, partial [Haliea sp.]